jgi:signal transduction histidine kinase
MSPVQQQINQFTGSRRWMNFIECVGIGLQVNIVILVKETIVLAAPECCPLCGATYKPLNGQDLSCVLNLITMDSKGGELLTGWGNQAFCLRLSGGQCLIVTDCLCSARKGLPLLRDRAKIAQELITGFQSCFLEGISGGQSTVELTALRHMNHIILSMFQGDRNARVKVLDLILSALVIMLDAQASWLEYTQAENSYFLIKGDRQALNHHLQTEKMDGSIKIAVTGPNINGFIGVLQPRDPERARNLLPLLGQECIIVFEIENLFKLVRDQSNRILGILKNAVLLIDEQGNILFANHTAEKLLEMELIDLIGTPVMQISSFLGNCLQSKISQPISGLNNIFGPETNDRLYDWQIVPFHEKSRQMGCLIIMEDKTNYYRLQEIGRRAESFSTISSIISPLAHELRNPLAAIKGLLQLAGRKKEPEKTRYYIDMVLQEIDRMSILVNEFLQLGRAADIHVETLDLAAFLKETLPLLEEETFGKDIQIVTDLEAVPPVSGDKAQLTQILSNLLCNAVEVMLHQQQGTVTISLRNRLDRVVLEVRDNGPGIPPETIDKLFQLFFTTKEQGNGLGLAIIKAIITSHGGQVTAANHPDGGAVFSMTFPVKGKQSREVKKLDVIIALAEDMLRYPMEQVLTASGFSIVATPDIAQVLRWEKIYLPRTVIFDLDSIMEAGPIQVIWPNAKYVAVGEPADFADETEGLQIIPKPIDYGRLVDELRSLIM